MESVGEQPHKSACEDEVSSSDDSTENSESQGGPEAHGGPEDSEDDPNCWGLQRKRSILRELVDVKKRLHIHLRKWETSNSTYSGHIQGNLDESLFPKGLGFFLMSQFLAHEEESVMDVREMIMNIGSLEIQDGLLTFLNDYVVQSRLVEEATNRREEILTNVIEWMENQGQNLIKLKSTGLDDAMGAEEKLSRVYLKTLSVMEKLAVLRKQLMLLDRAKKPQTPGSSDSTELLVPNVEAELEPEAATFQSSVRPYEDLLNLVQNVKNDSNRELMTTVEDKLESLGNVLTDRDGEVRQARATLRTKQEEREKLLEQIGCIKEYNDKMSVKIRELKEQDEVQKKEKAAERDEDTFLQKSLTVFKEDFSCQVSLENVRTESVSKTRPKPASPKRASDAAKIRKGSRLPRPPSPQKSGKRTSTDSTLDKRERSASTSPTPPPSRVGRRSSKSDDQSGQKKSLTHDTTRHARSSQQRSKSISGSSKPEESQTAAETSSQSSSIQSAGADESSAEFKRTRKRSSRRQMSKKERSSQSEDRGRKTLTSTDSSLGKLDISDKWDTSDAKVDLRLVIPHDRLAQLLQRHITNAVAVAQPLLEELIALRRNARTEIQRIKNRESFMLTIEEKMTTFLQQTPVDREKLPIIETTADRTNVVVSNRNPRPHKCPLCVCHDTTSKSVDLVDLKSPALLKKMMDTCQQYSDILANMRDSYMDICNRVTQGQAIIQTLLSQLVWGELGTSDYSNLDEEIDSEMQWAVKSVEKHLPVLLPDLLKHAIKVTNTVRLLVGDIVAILRHARIRITDLKTQGEQLCELEKFLGSARTHMDNTALQLSRLRAGAEPLRNENILGICKCSCCKCYNSVVDDGTRTTKADDRMTTNKLVLTKNMALLQQALGAVLRRCEQPADQTSVLAGVSPQVIEDVQETQGKLSEALSCMHEEDPEGSMRRTSVKHRSTAGHLAEVPAYISHNQA